MLPPRLPPLPLFLSFSLLPLALCDSRFYNSTEYDAGAYGLAPNQSFFSTLARPPALNILSQLPPPDNVFGDRDLGTGYVALGYYGPQVGQQGPMLFDKEGNLVFTGQQMGINGTIFDVQIVEYQGEPAIGWYNGSVVVPGGFGAGAVYLYNTAYQHIKTFDLQNFTEFHCDFHEWHLTKRGTVLIDYWVPTQMDLSSVGGPEDGWVFDGRFQEIDAVTNDLVFVWDAASHLNLTESYELLGGSGKTSNNAYDAFHLNSVDLDEDGNFLVSIRNLETVIKIDRATGNVVWRLGGKKSDFQLGEGATFYFQHHARWRNNDTQMTIFDNAQEETNPANETTSRGIVLNVDQQNMTATLALALIPSDGTTSGTQGSVQLLPNGNYFVGWGEQPFYSEYNSEGNLLYDVRFSSNLTSWQGVQSYRAFKNIVPWEATPSWPPAMYWDASTGTVYASWNGATGVSAWELVTSNTTTGKYAEALANDTGKFTKTGFESALSLDPTLLDGLELVSVRALDWEGKCMAAAPLHNATDGTQVVSAGGELVQVSC